MGYKSRLKQARRSSKEIIVAKTQDKIWTELDTYFKEKDKLDDQLWLSMEREVKSIKLNKSDIQLSYQAARLFLYETLLLERTQQSNIIKEDLMIFSTAYTKFELDIKKAGEMLFASGGMRDMHDPLLWSFIPRSMSRTIDIIWNDIGEWVS